MLYTEFNLEDAKEVWREEGFEDGIEKGKKEGREEGKKQGVIMVAVSLLGVLEDDVIA